MLAVDVDLAIEFREPSVRGFGWGFKPHGGVLRAVGAFSSNPRKRQCQIGLGVGRWAVERRQWAGAMQEEEDSLHAGFRLPNP